MVNFYDVLHVLAFSFPSLTLISFVHHQHKVLSTVRQRNLKMLFHTKNTSNVSRSYYERATFTGRFGLVFEESSGADYYDVHTERQSRWFQIPQV